MYSNITQRGISKQSEYGLQIDNEPTHLNQTFQLSWTELPYQAALSKTAIKSDLSLLPTGPNHTRLKGESKHF